MYNQEQAPPTPPPPPQSTDELVTGDISFDGGIHLCKKHKPKSKNRQGDPKYWFFNAVKHGCKKCVAFCVDSHGIALDVVSDTNKYTAKDFAHHYEDTDMLDFLQSLEL